MAADKTQNININYNFNTAQVERAKSLMQQADQANQKFQKSGQAAGQAVNSAFKTTTASIETLRAKVAVLQEQIIRASDPKVVKRLSDEYKKLKTQLDAATKSAFGLKSAHDQVSKSTKTTADSIGQAAKGIGNLYTGVKLFLAAGLLRETVNTAIEMARLSGNVEGVTRAFERKFPEATRLLFELREATKGTVTDFELMQRTLQATNLGVEVSKLPILFQFAAARAQQTGESVDYLVDSIVRGIGRKSILVLDNLGLSATRLKEQFHGASLASQSVAEVTAGVAEIAKQELQKMGGYAETAATKVDQLTTSWSELKKEVSQVATQDGGLIDQFKGFVDSFEALAEAQRRGITVSELYQERSRQLEAQQRLTRFENTALTGSQEENIATTEAEIQRLTRSVGAWAALRDEYNAQIRVIRGPYTEGRRVLTDSEEEEVALLKRLRDAKKDDALADQELVKLLNLRLLTLKQVSKETEEQLGLIAAKEEQIKSVGDQLEAAKSRTEIHNLNNELSKLNGELADLKALGTTKQFLNVGGKVKLVPVTEPKDLQKYQVDLENALGELHTKMKVTLDFERPDSNTILRDMFDDDFQQELIDNIAKPIATGQKQAFQPSFWDKIGDEFSENWKGILGQGLDDTANFFNSVIQADADQYDARLQQSKDFYDKQMTLAGDNETFKERLRLREANEERKLRMQAFEADKRAKKSQAAINGAVAITNAFATLGPIAGAVAAVVIAASTLAQIAAIDREKPRFAKGVLDLKGPGTGKSDSIDAKLSRGESVMTAEETRKSFGILKSIRAKTLDDKVLEDLRLGRDGVSYGGGMSDKRIVKELQTLRSSIPDYGEKYGVLWRTTSRSETYRKMVRAKTM